MPNNEKTLKHKPESFSEFADNTTLHGARFLSTKSIFRRNFWAVCLLGAATICFVQFKYSLDYFRSRPFSTVRNINREEKPIFPDVTICNLNFIHTGKYSKEVKKIFPNITDEEIEQDFSELSKRIGVLFDSGVKTKNISRMDRINALTRILPSISHVIDDILLPKELHSCTWAGKTCGAEHFRLVNITKYNQCSTFKPWEGERNIYQYYRGLRLQINAGTQWYLPNPYEPFVGLKVYVHASDQYPQIDDFGFLIEPGVHTSCAVRRTQFVNLGKPYHTNCGEEDLKFAKTSRYSYSRRLCIEDCFFKMLASRCHCKNMEMKGDLPLCTDEKQISCVVALNKNETKEVSFLKCVAGCRESCKFSLYQISLSTAKLNARVMAKDFDDFCKMKNQNPSLCQEIQNKSQMEKMQYVRDNIVSLDIFLQSDHYEEVEQIPAFEWFELLSDIGGNLGLFLGVSILTLMEYVDYFIRVLWYKLRKTAKPKTIEMKSRGSHMQ